LYLKGEMYLAINDYTVAIALKPDDAYSYLGLGLAYGKLGQVRKAEENLRKACDLGSRDACSVLKSRTAIPIFPEDKTLITEA